MTDRLLKILRVNQERRERAETERLRADLKAMELALWQFADVRNWSDQVGCLQWIGKRHAIEYARSVVEGLSSPFGEPFTSQPAPPPPSERDEKEAPGDAR